MIKCLGYRAIARVAPWFVALVLATVAACPASAQTASPNEGQRIFKSANCVGCHKWTGQGGGGYGGAAANLRETQLSAEQIEETIRCGRPMTGMPHFEADAYSDGHCYGMKQADLPDGKMPPEPDHPLRPADIKAVAAYVMTTIKGKGEPTFDQCSAFFGTGSRVCDVYANQPGATTQRAGASPGVAGGGGHMKVESAADANVGSPKAGQ